MTQETLLNKAEYYSEMFNSTTLGKMIDNALEKEDYKFLEYLVEGAERIEQTSV